MASWRIASLSQNLSGDMKLRWQWTTRFSTSRMTAALTEDETNCIVTVVKCLKISTYFSAWDTSQSSQHRKQTTPTTVACSLYVRYITRLFWNHPTLQHTRILDMGKKALAADCSPLEAHANRVPAWLGLYKSFESCVDPSAKHYEQASHHSNYQSSRFVESNLSRQQANLCLCLAQRHATQDGVACSYWFKLPSIFNVQMPQRTPQPELPDPEHFERSHFFCF